MRDTTYKFQNFRELVVDTSVTPVWAPDGSCVGFVSGAPDQRQAWRVDLSSGKKMPLADVAKLRNEIFRATGVTPPGQGVPFEHFAFVGPQTIAFAVAQDRLTYDLQTGVATKA